MARLICTDAVLQSHEKTAVQQTIGNILGDGTATVHLDDEFGKATEPGRMTMRIRSLSINSEPEAGAQRQAVVSSFTFQCQDHTTINDQDRPDAQSQTIDRARSWLVLGDTTSPAGISSDDDAIDSKNDEHKTTPDIEVQIEEVNAEPDYDRCEGTLSTQPVHKNLMRRGFVHVVDDALIIDSHSHLDIVKSHLPRSFETHESEANNVRSLISRSSFAHAVTTPTVVFAVDRSKHEQSVAAYQDTHADSPLSNLIRRHRRGFEFSFRHDSTNCQFPNASNQRADHIAAEISAVLQEAGQLVHVIEEELHGDNPRQVVADVMHDPPLDPAQGKEQNVDDTSKSTSPHPKIRVDSVKHTRFNASDSTNMKDSPDKHHRPKSPKLRDDAEPKHESGLLGYLEGISTALSIAGRVIDDVRLSDERSMRGAGDRWSGHTQSAPPSPPQEHMLLDVDAEGRSTQHGATSFLHPEAAARFRGHRDSVQLAKARIRIRHLSSK